MIQTRSQTKQRGRKRTMEPHLGGDNKAANEEGAQGNVSPLPGGAASGDSHGDEHQFIGLVSKQSEDGGTTTFEIIKQNCPLDDSWVNKYTLPLSKFSKSRRFRTGNNSFDKVLPQLEDHGYRPLQILGRGRRSIILLCQNMKTTLEESRECVPVVLKLIIRKGKGRSMKGTPDKLTEDPVVEEVSIHESIEHPNIVSMLDSFSVTNCTGLIMELCENGHLDQLLRAQDARLLTEPVARKYFHQLHSAIEYLHMQAIAHLDICPRNILVGSDGILKICDFGDARKYFSGDPSFNHVTGSLGFQAPEVLQESLYNPRLVDIWSLGAVLFTMTGGRLPFGNNKKDYLQKAEKGLEFPPTNVLLLTPTLKDLLRGILSYLPEARHSLNRVRNSDWFQTPNNKVQIGNFYLVRQPRKVSQSEKELKLKMDYGI